MNPDRMDAINIGDEAEICHTITETDVDTFARLTGDNNPLHMDENFAAGTNFQKRVVHGMLTASFISTLIGTKLPGEGALWFEQQTRFISPVRIGEKIRVWAKVKHKSMSQRVVVLETLIFGDDGRQVVAGEAKVKILKQEEKMERNSFQENKAVVVSGSSRGIGAAIAIELAANGYPVVINYRRDEEQAIKTKDQITASGGRAIIFKADIANEAEVNQMVALANEQFGGLSGIVNNACGNIEIKGFAELSWEEIQNHLDIQLKGAFNLSKAALPFFQEQKYGTIVNIGSVYTENVPPIKMLSYVTAKSAMLGFSKSLATELGPLGIRVNTISPGMTHTDLISNVPEKTKLTTKMQTPLRRLAAAEEIAGTVGFLFSEKARFITGENIRVCGGVAM